MGRVKSRWAGAWVSGSVALFGLGSPVLAKIHDDCLLVYDDAKLNFGWVMLGHDLSLPRKSARF